MTDISDVMPEAPDMGAEQTDLAPFEQYWESALHELGFQTNEYGEIVFGDVNAYASQTGDEDGEEGAQRLDPALYRSVIGGMVDRVLQTYGEEVAQDRLLRDAVVAFLAAQPPQNLSEAGVRLITLAGLGLRSLREREYHRMKQEKQMRSNPKSALNPNFRSAAERLAEQMGIDPDDLISEYIQEWNKKGGGF